MRFKAEFLQKFEIWGGQFQTLFGTNRCKKSECLKTGAQGDLRRDGPEAVAPLKENKEASDSHRNGSNTACVPSGTVPDTQKGLNLISNRRD